ncbi:MULTISPECIES: hypothetical protein [unclassified Streptomyces]|uniref:hypothetical protein n=1 Tax=unclassified Streptomyces TaxID=2593676 RepID=UPI00190803B0|nr:hypothetical protein [Streptomyces sp. HSG2]
MKMKRACLPVRLVLAVVLTAVCSVTAGVAELVRTAGHPADVTRTVAEECSVGQKCTADTSWGG